MNNPVTGIVLRTQDKTGTSSKGYRWKRWGVVLESGAELSTFEPRFEPIIDSLNKGDVVTIGYRAKGPYFNITQITKGASLPAPVKKPDITTGVVTSVDGLCFEMYGSAYIFRVDKEHPEINPGACLEVEHYHRDVCSVQPSSKYGQKLNGEATIEFGWSRDGILYEYEVSLDGTVYYMELRGRQLPIGVKVPLTAIVVGENFDFLLLGDVVVGDPIYPEPEVRFTNYDWPGPSPYQHQIETAALIVEAGRGFVFDPLGTGKTLSAVYAADYLMKRGVVKRVLVESPLAVQRVAWEKEIKRVGRTCSGKWNDYEDAEFVIVNPEYFRRFANNPEQAKEFADDFDMLISDEGGRYHRNQSSLQSRGLREVARHIPRVAWLTAYPTPNKLDSIISQSKIVRPELPISRAVEAGEYAVACTLLTYSSRHSLEECVDLPPITHSYREATMADLKKRQLDQILDDADPGDAFEAEAVFGKLLAAVMDDEGRSRASEIQTIFDEGEGEPLVVFCPYLKPLHAISAELSKTMRVAVLEGAVNQDDRSQIIEDFQNGKYDVLIGTPQTGGIGITLTRAATAVWVCPCKDLDHMLQANGRIRRIGQDKHQQIIKLFGSDVEYAAYERLETKESIQETLLKLIQLRKAKSGVVGKPSSPAKIKEHAHGIPCRMEEIANA